MSTAGAISTSDLSGSPFELRIDNAKDIPEADVSAAVASGDLGFVHSFTTGSAVDGPGLRFVAWTTGCGFRCAYCHNPDTWKLRHGTPVTIDRAIEELRKYAPGLKVMKGGFTLSGGEPLVQHRFAVKLFRAAKSMGLHTAIETNGIHGAKLTDDELALIDLVILDMKAFGSEQHERVTGVAANAPVLEFAKRLAALKRPMWLRYVLVSGLTDVEEEMRAIAAFAASLGVVERAEILPFHQMGRFKWKQLEMDYSLDTTEPPSVEAVARAVAIFRKAGLQAA